MSYRPCSIVGCPNRTRRGSGRCHEHRYADRDARVPPAPPVAATRRAAAAETAVRAALGDAPRIEVSTFVSGAVDLLLRDADGVVSIQCHSGGRQWGVTIDPGDGPTGHDAVVTSIDEVVEVLRARRPGR